jgi:YidC/Oxa1 family membrane protein insertase
MLSIIVLTVAVSAATAPLTFLAMRSQRKLAALQPEMAKLRKAHANDRQQLAVATTELFRAHGVSPLGGCLPSLIQAPVFILMFRHVRKLAADGLHFGRIDLAQTGVTALQAGLLSAAFLGVLLVVTIGSTLLQLRMTPRTATTEPTPAERVMRYMPVAFGAWALGLPLAVGVYYATSSLLRVALHWGVNRHLSA